MYGPGTNPTPYIVASYLIGAICIFGFSGYLLIQRAKLKKLLSVINSQGKE